MKRGPIVAIVLLLLALVVFFGWRSYQSRQQETVAARDVAAEQAEGDRLLEEQKKAAQDAEAKRLAALAAEAAAAKAAAEEKRLADEAAAAEQARLAALEKLRAEEAAAKAAADREAAHAAALKAQQEREAALAKAAADLEAELRNRIIYSADYKRRSHYYKQVDLTNAEIPARVEQLRAEAAAAANPAP